MFTYIDSLDISICFWVGNWSSKCSFRFVSVIAARYVFAPRNFVCGKYLSWPNSCNSRVALLLYLNSVMTGPLFLKRNENPKQINDTKQIKLHWIHTVALHKVNPQTFVAAFVIEPTLQCNFLARVSNISLSRLHAIHLNKCTPQTLSLILIKSLHWNNIEPGVENLKQLITGDKGADGRHTWSVSADAFFVPWCKARCNLRHSLTFLHSWNIQDNHALYRWTVLQRLHGFACATCVMQCCCYLYLVSLVQLWHTQLSPLTQFYSFVLPSQSFSLSSNTLSLCTLR